MASIEFWKICKFIKRVKNLKVKYITIQRIIILKILLGKFNRLTILWLIKLLINVF